VTTIKGLRRFRCTAQHSIFGTWATPRYVLAESTREASAWAGEQWPSAPVVKVTDVEAEARDNAALGESMDRHLRRVK
jgi:hypothetical protein